MLYAFTDESYVADNYLQGAFVVDESDLGSLEDIVSITSEFALRFGVAPGTELRGYSIMNSKHGWEPLREKFHARIAIYKFLLTRIAEVDGHLSFAEEIQSPPYFEKSSNYSRHIVTHNQMLEKLNLMGSKFKNEIMIYADEITSQRKLAVDFKEQSHRYSKIKSLNFVDSEKNAGVQIIDAILYIYQRRYQVNTVERRSNNVTFELWDLVEHLLLK